VTALVGEAHSMLIPVAKVAKPGIPPLSPDPFLKSRKVCLFSLKEKHAKAANRVVFIRATFFMLKHSGESQFCPKYKLPCPIQPDYLLT